MLWVDGGNARYSAMRYRFATCEIDTEAFALTRDGAAVHVEPQVFDLLRLLVEARGALVSRDSLIETVWGGRIVSEATISSRINAARRAVGDTGADQAVIRTVSRRGLQLAVPVDGRAGPATRDQPAAAVRDAAAPIRFARAADGAALAWRATGEGPPLLRVSHWLSHLDRDPASPVWGPLLDRLGKGRRLVCSDLRGTGLSERGTMPFTPETFGADLAAIAAAAVPDVPVDIFAASQGAAAAIVFASDQPGRVRRMVLCGGFAQGTRRRGELSARMAEGLLEMTRAGWGRGGSPFMKSVAALFMPGATEAQLADFCAIQLASAEADTAVSLRRALSEVDIVDRLASVRCPVLVAHSEGDALHPVSQGRLIASGIPGAEFLSLEGDSHVILPQSPAFARLMDALDAFLGGGAGELTPPAASPRAAPG